MKLVHHPHLAALGAAIILSCSPVDLQKKETLLYESGISSLALGDYHAALSSFTEITDNYPASSIIDNAWYYRGVTYELLAEDAITEIIISQDYFQKALDAFSRVDTLSSRFTDALFEKGYSHYHLNEFSVARSLFHTIITEYPAVGKVDNAYLYIAHTYRQEQNADSSIFWYESVIAQFPETSTYDNALFWAGDYYFDNRTTHEGFAQKALLYLQTYLSLPTANENNVYLAQLKIEVLNNE